MDSTYHPTRVFVATTGGPVEVQRITEEDPDVASVVCLGGKAIPLPISNSYDAFVRAPTGVIQATFGPSAFRADVSAPIEDGFSWQLGLFLAHAVVAGPGLGKSDDDSANLVIATGEVDRDLRVHAVDHMAAKLEKLAATNGDFKGATLFVPRDNLPGMESAVADDLGLKVVGVATVSEMLEVIGLPLPAKTSRPFDDGADPVKGAAASEHPWVTTPPDQRWSLTRRIAVLAVLLVAVLVGLGGWLLSGRIMAWQDLYQEGRLATLEQEMAEARSPLSHLQSRLFRAWLQSQRVAPEAIIAAFRIEGLGAGPCRAARKTGAGPRTGYLDDFNRAPTSDKPTPEAGCEIVLDLETQDDIGLSTRLIRLSGPTLQHRRPDIVARLGKNSNGDWREAMPTNTAWPLRYRLIAVAVPGVVTGPEPWFPALYGLGIEGRAGERADRVKARLEATGATVVMVERVLDQDVVPDGAPD